MGCYKNAQVCLNGHSTTSDTAGSRELMSKFCGDCGTETITQCPSCNSSIRGSYHVEGVISICGYTPPNFCHSCGEAFPWTKAKLEAAIELTEEFDELDSEEKDKLKGALDDLVRDTPKTEVAAHRFNKILKKVSGGAGSVMKDIVVSVASETAKKMLLG
ncbi:DUF2321 domain-containing protein [Terasakiella sp. SH-1]|uniref:DUF2321 domain-containing protein n=1 Tax=Terasakiella sp. SH-1 TaxID=2560057 RepID=UPI00107422D6|nr:DUF2321 domain-containing protein [Terasakiella sp. SH-1]